MKSKARSAPSSWGWLRTVAPLPAAVLAVLPSFTCPVCIAAYAGVLSSMGLGFMYQSKYQTPLIVGFLLVGIATVAYSSRTHKKRSPVLLTLLGAAGVVAGKLVWEVPLLMYGGAALLFGATLYNLWLKRPKRTTSTGEVPADAMEPAASVVIQVQGLACGGCVGQLKRALLALTGVRSVELDGERAHIEYAPSRTQPDTLCRAIDALGYTALECT